MSTALLCFGSTFISVFALGLQSQNVNQGHYWAAAFTSLLIGGGHIALYRYMPNANWVELAAYLVGGVTGITFSMWFHRTVKAWWKARHGRGPARMHHAHGQYPRAGRCRDEHATQHLSDTH